MTDEHKHPAEKLLDLFVFGPAGLAATAADEFPRLVEKGRHRVEGQMHAARLVGQFAVQMARRQVEQVVGSLVARGSGNQAAAPEAAGSPDAASPVPPAAEGAAAGSPVSGVTTAGSTNGTLASGALGIPGYDSLSASQVVQRLGGLSEHELEAVRGHEVAHRHRRTILNRVDQLLAGEDELG